MDSAGDCVVFYYWDNGWGYNPISDGPLASTLGTLNPLRYRSYVYDTETGYYYLQSRYYDPEIGRFINADILVTTGQGLLGNNMFAYCGNNPVMRKDSSGNFWLTSVVVGAVIGAAFGVASELVSQTVNHITTGEKINWGDVLTSAAGGAMYGGVIAATGSHTAATIASSVTTSVITGIRNGDSIEETIVNTVGNALCDTVISIVIPKVVNKSLSGKYLNLNNAEKFIKYITSEPYSGMYHNGRNYIPEVLTEGLKDLAQSALVAGISVLQLL